MSHEQTCSSSDLLAATVTLQLVQTRPERAVQTRFSDLPGLKVTLRSQVGVGKHGVLLPDGAEPFDGVDEFLIVHKL